MSDAADEFDCPVCTETFTGSILQCKEGHLFCAECDAKFATRTCPVCRGALPAVGAGVVNRFAMAQNEKRRIDCGSGCDAKGLAPAQLKAHRAECARHQPIRCWLTDVCTRVGMDVKCDKAFANEAEMLAHMTNDHFMIAAHKDHADSYIFRDDTKYKPEKGHVSAAFWYVAARRTLVVLSQRLGEVSFVTLTRCRGTSECICIAPFPDPPNEARVLRTMRVASETRLVWPRSETTSNIWLVAFGASEGAALIELARYLEGECEVRQPSTKKRRIS